MSKEYAVEYFDKDGNSLGTSVANGFQNVKDGAPDGASSASATAIGDGPLSGVTANLDLD
jgi:hypothetical protein